MPASVASVEADTVQGAKASDWNSTRAGPPSVNTHVLPVPLHRAKAGGQGGETGGNLRCTELL